VDQGYTALSVGSGALSPLTLNDTSSIVQHDNTDCKQFEGAAEQGLSEPRNDMCVESTVQHDDTDCKQFEGEVEQGLSVPKVEVSSDRVENVTGVNSAVCTQNLYKKDRHRVRSSQLARPGGLPVQLSDHLNLEMTSSRLSFVLGERTKCDRCTSLSERESRWLLREGSPT